MATRDDWQRRLGPLYGGAVALVHSTPWRWPVEVAADPRAAGWLVVLGVPIGAVAWLVAALAHGVGLSATIAALFGLAALSAASAALIDRGLAARVDHWENREAGPGVAALLVIVLATLIRAAAITALPAERWLGVLVATAVIGRWAAMLIQALGDPIDAAGEGARRSLVATPAPAWLAAAISLAVAVLAVLAIGKLGMLAMAIGALAAFGLGLHAQRRDGRLSAPVVAMVAAIGELAVLLVASA